MKKPRTKYAVNGKALGKSKAKDEEKSFFLALNIARAERLETDAATAQSRKAKKPRPGRQPPYYNFFRRLIASGENFKRTLKRLEKPDNALCEMAEKHGIILSTESGNPPVNPNGKGTVVFFDIVDRGKRKRVLLKAGTIEQIFSKLRKKMPTHRGNSSR